MEKMENRYNPYEWIDTNITGRQFNKDDVAVFPFMAGSLRQIILSDKFSLAPQQLRRQIQHLSFLMHVVARFDNFQDVFRFNLNVHGDINCGRAFWEDNEYFEEVEGKYLCDLLKGEEIKTDLVIKEEIKENGIEFLSESYMKADNGYLSDKSWENNENGDKFCDEVIDENDVCNEGDYEHDSQTKKIAKKKEKLSCPLCLNTSKRFISYKRLIFHFKKKHNQVKDFRCKECDGVFEDVVKLSKHIATHKSEVTDIKEEANREEFCNDCNCMIQMVGNDSMAKHSNSFHKEKINCPYCKKVVLSEKVLLTHIKKQHANLENKETLLCSKCGFTTDNIGEYAQHKISHVDSNKCKICEKVFANMSSLKQHMKYSHPSGSDTPREREVCSHCGKSYKHMAFHIYKSHSNNSHKCSECEYTSPLKALVKIHYRGVHEQILSTCEDCGKVVKKIGHHKLRGCPARKKKPKLDCSHCDKSFSLPEGLKRHVRNIHLNIKDKSCPHCDYKTAVGFNLRIHITRVHEGKQFKTTCQYCGKNVNSLEWHIKTYHIKEYESDSISNGFNNEEKALVMLKD